MCWIGRLGGRTVGNSGRGLRELHQFIERQVDQVVAAAFLIHQYLGGVGQDLLHGILIKAFASHLGGFAVLRQHLLESRRLALGVGDHPLLIAEGFLMQTRGHTACLGDDIVGIGLTFVLEPLAILAGLDGVIEGGLHLFGRLGVLQVDLADADAGLVAVEDVLHQFGGPHGDLGTTFVEDKIHAALADDFAHGRLRCLLHGVVRAAVVEQVVFRILDCVLNRELQIDDVLVIGQHQHLAQHLGLDVVVIADFDGAHLLDVDHQHFLDRKG